MLLVPLVPLVHLDPLVPLVPLVTLVPLVSLVPLVPLVPLVLPLEVVGHQEHMRSLEPEVEGAGGGDPGVGDVQVAEGRQVGEQLQALVCYRCPGGDRQMV